MSPVFVTPAELPFPRSGAASRVTLAGMGAADEIIPDQHRTKAFSNKTKIGNWSTGVAIPQTVEE